MLSYKKTHGQFFPWGTNFKYKHYINQCKYITNINQYLDVKATLSLALPASEVLTGAYFWQDLYPFVL